MNSETSSQTSASSMTAHSDYRSILKSELELRCQKNHRYSLRAFARSLGMTSARLSEVINGRSGLSRDSAVKITKALGYQAYEKEYFITLVEAEDARSRAQRDLARIRLEKFKPLDFKQIQLDSFVLISEWYHFAILELMTLPLFSSDAAWIARSLGITPIESKLALERLMRLGMIRKLADGTLKASDEFSTTGSGVSSDAIKKYHQKILEKAQAALFTQSLEERDFSTMVMAIDREDLPRVQERIKTFRRQIAKEFEGQKTRNAVYCLAVQCFELTTGAKK